MEVALRSDMFIIPVSDDKNIIYAPLRGIAFYANDRAANLCKSYIKGDEIADNSENVPLRKHIELLERTRVNEPNRKPFNTISNLVIILSQMCNLACSYCFAQESRSKDALKKIQVKAAIDFIMAQKSKRKHFSFIGGGEPTLTWEMLKWSIRYIRSFRFDANNIKIGITTNGTLLDDDKIEFFRENDVNIGLSFEILPDIQSNQRCFAKSNKNTFEVVDGAIKKLKEKGVRISFRSTITKLNVMRMPEMVRFVIKQYPFMKKLHFEHVTSTENDKEFYDDFIRYFMEARRIGQKKGINIYCSVSHGFEKLKSSFCGGEFCLTPSGEFVSCHRISSKEEKAFDLFNYARIKDGLVFIDLGKKERLEDFYNTKREECASCYAKWHCAGSCAMEKTIYNDEMRDLKCYYTKELTKELLIERLNPVS